MKKLLSWPFRAFLGREAEPERAPSSAESAGMTDDSLRRQADAQFVLGRREIETSIDDPATMQKFMARVIAQWQALGDSDPFWSNDTREEFRQANITEDAIQGFYAGGADVRAVIAGFESRSSIEIPRGVCIELGCGVGKHTHTLAKQFEHVFAIDVAAKPLALCAGHMKAVGRDNVTTVLLTSPDDLAQCGEADFFFCLSVLQHNPPPLQRMLLDRAFSRVRPGGLCLFQTPDWIENYSFSTQRFLSQQDALFDLHCLPKTSVLDTLAANGMRLLDFAPDFTVGSFGSYTYFARKQAGAETT